jgi:cytochrome c-type biogenesis protein CcmH
MSLNRRLHGWVGWSVLALVLVALLTIGTTRDSGPTTQQDRVDSISKRLACPTCDGESIYESRAPAAEAIRQDIARRVNAGVQSDDEIVTAIDSVQPTSILLLPKASGFDALIWVMPIAVLILAVAGLAVAFRRWRREIDTMPTDEDRELVAAAMHAEFGGDDDDGGR